MSATITSLHGMMQLPPMDVRITPPPEELNVVIPKLQTFPVLPLSPASLPDTPHTDTSSVASPSPRKKRRRSSGSRNHTSKADTKQQAQVNSSLLFSPRPFEGLYIERAYLATSLQQQAGRAAGLMRQYCAVELQLQSLVGGDNGRRKLRKQLSLLKSRVNQAAEQEKVIFSRLGELYVEIQSRETWAQAWSVDSSSVSTPLYFSPVSCSFPTPTSPLGGASADFTPMGYFSDFHQVTKPAYFHQEPAMYGLETVDEAGEDLLYDPTSSGESVESETTPAPPLTADIPSVEEKNECVLETEKNPIDGRSMSVRERRLSLPCLHNAWL
ncbi:hypothetical protein FAVG1_00118 [Fusarium avenaceum]|nr:hypothetical protein FAVG1_00118 [Fusarium avenaceum]